MAFIRTIPPAEAEGATAAMYEAVRSRLGYVPNWAQAFSARPGVMDGWAGLLKSVQANLSTRAYELATLAAARALRSSYCSLAHGSVLAQKVLDPAALTAILKDEPGAPLSPAERAMMAFAEKVALHADRVTAAEVEALRSHGYRDEEIFDIAAAAAARCFFSKLLDAVGAEPDAAFNDMDPALRQLLTVGRPVAASAEVSDRVLATARVLDAPPARVFAAFRDPARLARWWGPRGFTNTFHEFDFRPGGSWRFAMHGPNGASYPNLSVFVEIAEPDRIVLRHVSGPEFEMTITLADHGGKTRLGWRMLFDSPAVCAQVKKFAVDANEQNLDRLEAELAR